MADQSSNQRYGLSGKDSRKMGFNQPASDPKDVMLEADIARQIRRIGGEHIRVRVKSGKVTLSGMADDFSTKRDVLRVIQQIPGVVKVTNQIKVIPGDSGSPGRGGS